MRKKRLVNVLTSAALTAALVMSMGITVMADDDPTGVTSGTEESAVGSVTITKTVKTDGNTYQPNTTFTFKVEPGEAGKYEDQTVYAGISEGLSISGSADFSYRDASSLEVAESKEYKDESASIVVNSSSFDKVTPGIYHYVVSETSGSYSGVTYDNTKYDVYVYVLNDGGSNYVGYVVVVNEDGVKSNLSFENDYGANDTNGGSTHDLTITKKLAGDLQNASDEFTVTVAVTDGGTGQAYKVVVSNGSEESTYKVVGGGNAVGITIEKDSAITIYGLTSDATVTVKETDTNGYTAAYTTTASGLTSNGATLTGTVEADGTTATLTNTKSATTPTGVVLNFAPYILLVAFASVFAVLFLGKKREEV